MSVKIFRSTDTNAPKLNGIAGSLVDVLLACLVNGYGSSFATGTITSSGVNVSNNDTVTVDNVTYTFKTSLTPAANEVLIGASAAASLANLAAAINLQGTSGTTYGASTQTPKQAYASAVSSTVITITARRGGSTGNAVALAKSAATLTLSASTLAGASGSDSTTSADWSNPYSGNGGQRTFKGGSGIQHFFHVDDATPNTTALGKEAGWYGTETATGFQTGTGLFPTAAQLSTGLLARKSTTADLTSRSWTVIADDRTCYVMMQSGDTVGMYMTMAFGEIYSRLSPGPDAYRSFTQGRTLANNGAILSTTDTSSTITTFGTQLAGCYLSRAYTGGGTAIQFGKHIDGAYITGTSVMGNNTNLAGVDPATGSIKLCPVRISEIAINNAMRGRFRGLFSHLHTSTTFGDQDPIVGSGAFTGRSFLVFRTIAGNGGSLGSWVFDLTGPWDTN
jgi:hypothetical protein